MMNLFRRSTLPVHIVVCLIAMALGGCQRRHGLVDMLGTAIDDLPFNYRGDPRQLAPIIVVASVEDNQIVAKHLEASHYQGVYLDLHTVRAKREYSLKGGLTGSALRFFYFADGKYPDSKPNPRYKRFFQAKPGSRYLFFLIRDRGVLRSIGDVGNDYSVLVSTGTHHEETTESGDIGKRISELLLTPGDGSDIARMAGQLSEYSGIADVWGSRTLTVQLLRHLFSLGEPLRSAACGELVSRYRGQYDCLQTMAEDTKASAELRQRVLTELKQQSVERQLLLDDLKDPARLAYQDWAGDSRRRVREELETLLFAPDAALREHACIALRRYYPNDPEPRCVAE